VEVPVSRSLNKVILIGNLGQDPEVRSTSGGGRVANFSLATSRQWSGQGGDKQEKTEWHRIVAWNNNKGGGTGLADIIEKFCKKGDKLYVEGRIEYRSWQDKDGQTRYTTEVIANEIIMLSGKGGGSGEGGFSPAKAGAAATAPAKKEGKEGKESFDDFPEALDSEDDDLPF
jgi:single-strand DNA-binding protein